MQLTLFVGFFFGTFLVATADNGYKRVCYYTNWSQYRLGDGKYTPSDIDPSLCTNLIYAFAKLEGTQLKTLEANDEQLYREVNALKAQNPGLKTSIAVGGWNAGSVPFSSMAASQSSRAAFIQSTIQFLRKYGFDGLDIDWEYPAARGGQPGDKQNMALLVKEMRAAFEQESASSGKERLLISVAVPAGKSNIDNGYDVRAVGASVDFINLMSYDIHGSWERNTGENSPLLATGGDTQLSTAWAANYWASQGAPKDKIIIGMSFNGQSFNLANTANTGMGAPSSGPGPAGQYTGQAGMLSYYEICKKMEAGGTDNWDGQQHVPYYVNGNLWVGYDNVRSVTEKSEWLKTNGFGGAMVWSLDSDDFKKICASSSTTYPLMRAITNALQGTAPPSVVTTMQPVVTTMQPVATTIQPVATTLQPGVTTMQPGVTTMQPGVTTMPIVMTTVAQPITQKTWWPPVTTKIPSNPSTVQVQTNGPTQPITQKTWWPPATTKIPSNPSTVIVPITTPMNVAPTTVNTDTGENFSCTDDHGDGYHASTHSCTVYYRCSNGDAVRFECSPGTNYNPRTKQCDWPYNVHCTLALFGK